MGAVRISVQTAHYNNPQVINMTPVLELTSCEVNSWVFPWKKSIIKTFLTLNCCFRLKYEYIIHNIAFSIEKKNKHLVWIRREICSDQAPFTSQNSYVANKYVGGFLFERTTGDGLFHWKRCYYGLWTRDGLNTCKDLFLTNMQTLTDGMEWCGLLVDYCDVFISCFINSYSDGTHSLQRIPVGEQAM